MSRVVAARARSAAPWFLLAGALGACDSPSPAEETPAASVVSALSSAPPPVVVSTIRIDGLAWKASDGDDIVSQLPVFVVRVEGSGDRFQVVEQTGTSCDLAAPNSGTTAPSAARWKLLSDLDGFQTVTTGKGLRHFCAFLRNPAAPVPSAGVPFTVTVTPEATNPYGASGDPLAVYPSVAGSATVPGAANTTTVVRFIAGFGMRNSGRWSPTLPVPPATDYASLVPVVSNAAAATDSFAPPANKAPLQTWERYAISYLKSATSDPAKVRLFVPGANDAPGTLTQSGFEPLATLDAKLQQLTPWQLYRLASLFRLTENLKPPDSAWNGIVNGSKWFGASNGIPDWRAFRRWHEVLWSSVEGDHAGPRIYFGRYWNTPAQVTALPDGSAPPDTFPGLALDPAGMAFWATFTFPTAPTGDRIENPFTRTPLLQEKATRLALVTTLYQALVVARSIRVATDCQVDENIGPQLKLIFKAIDTLRPQLLAKPEFAATLPALRAMTQEFLVYLNGLAPNGSGGTNMCLPEVAAAYYAVRANPGDAYWRYLRDAREQAIYEHVYPAIHYHDHGSFSLEASYEGIANSHETELCGVLGSPLACTKLYLSNRLKRDLLVAEPDYTEPTSPTSATPVARAGQLKGPSGTNTSTPDSSANDIGIAGSRDQVTDQLFPGFFNYLVAHARRSFLGGHAGGQLALSAYHAFMDHDLARYEILDALTSKAARLDYVTHGHANTLSTAAPGIQDFFDMPEGDVPVPADIYAPSNNKCITYAKITSDILYRSTDEATETGGPSGTENAVTGWAQSTLENPTVSRFPGYAEAPRPGLVRYTMPHAGKAAEDLYVRFDGTTYSASFYAGPSGWNQGVWYEDATAKRMPSVRGFGPGLLTLSVFANTNQTQAERNLSGPLMLSGSDGGQSPGDDNANWLDRAQEFAHPAIVGLARPVGTPPACAGYFTTARQRYSGGTKLTETRAADGTLSTLALATRGFVNQELNLFPYDGSLSIQANKDQNQLLVTGKTAAQYLQLAATDRSKNIGYGMVELIRPDAGNTACTAIPLPFTLEFLRNYVARTNRIDVSVTLKAPTSAPPANVPLIFYKSLVNAPNVLFDALDEVVPLYHDVRTPTAPFDPDAAGSAKVWTRPSDASGTAWTRLLAIEVPVAAKQIFVARYGGGAVITLPATRNVRLGELGTYRNNGRTQNLLIGLLPAAPPAQGYTGVTGLANTVNLTLTYQITPRTTATLPP